MTRSLPDEILLTVFNNLHPSDLLNCQQICRSWYSSAHSQLLKEVKLSCEEAVEQFIVSFDRDSNHPDFKAVKTIRFCWQRRVHKEMEQMVFERETIEKLFFRFPNLENVYINFPSMITNFDEDPCKAFLTQCPKLNTFEVVGDVSEIYDSLHKVRLLLTNIELCPENLDDEGDNPIQLITQFPRLKSIYCNHTGIDSFADVLPILEQLSNVDTLHLVLFDEKHVYYKRKEVEELFKQRFYNITDLYIEAHDNLSNTIKLVSDYLTNLKCCTVKHACWNLDRKQDLFLRNTFNLIQSVKGDYRADIDSMPFTSLANTFTCLIQNMFDTIPPVRKQRNSRVLALVMTDSKEKNELSVCLLLESSQSPLSRITTIRAKERTNINKFVELFKSDAPMDQVDVFDLQFNYNDSYKTLLNTENYLSILGTMSSLKEVILQVPAIFKETKHQDNRPYIGPVLPQVEQATFKATPDGTIQSLLNSCCYTFPNLKRLNIQQFSGTWRPHIGEFLLDLQNYSIEKLVLDTNPVVAKMNKLKVVYFVVEAEIRSSGKRRFYKVSLDHSTCNRINFCDLEGITCGIDYLRVRLTVNNSKQVELCQLHVNGQRCVIVFDK